MAIVLDKLITVLGFSLDQAALRRFDSRIKSTKDKLNKLSGAALGAGSAVGAAGAVATGAFALAIKQAIEWESDFTGVRKTVNATEEEFAALEARLRQMAKAEVPLPLASWRTWRSPPGSWASKLTTSPISSRS